MTPPTLNVAKPGPIRDPAAQKTLEKLSERAFVTIVITMQVVIRYCDIPAVTCDIDVFAFPFGQFAVRQMTLKESRRRSRFEASSRPNRILEPRAVLRNVRNIHPPISG